MTAATPSCRPDAEVVALGDVVGEHDLRSARCAEHGEQHVALEGLRLVDDDEGVVEGAATDVGQRQDLEQPAVQISSTTSVETSAPRVSKTAWAHGLIFSCSVPGR